MTGNVEASPDFRRELSLVLLNQAGEELFRSPPHFSAVESERIGEAGVDEFFSIRLAEASGSGSRNTCVVVADLEGTEIFRTPAFLSSSDADQIKADGIDDHFALTIAPAEGIRYAGMRWDFTLLCWQSLESRELQVA